MFKHVTKSFVCASIIATEFYGLQWYIYINAVFGVVLSVRLGLALESAIYSETWSINTCTIDKLFLSTTFMLFFWCKYKDQKDFENGMPNMFYWIFCIMFLNLWHIHHQKVLVELERCIKFVNSLQPYLPLQQLYCKFSATKPILSNPFNDPIVLFWLWNLPLPMFYSTK